MSVSVKDCQIRLAAGQKHVKLLPVANIRIKRRTQSIDDDREKLLGYGPLGPIHTTVGAFNPTGDQKHELSAKLAAKQRYADVQVIKTKVQEAAAGFFEQVITRTAPDAVVADYYTSDQPTLFLDWLVKSGFRLVCDGFHAIVLRNGEEIARTTAKVPAWCADEVLVALRVDQMVEKGSNGGH